MALPLLQTDSQNERQHRTLIATTVNSLIPLRQPNDRTDAEIDAGVTPSNLEYAPGPSGGHIFRFIPKREHSAILDGTSTYDASADIQKCINALQPGDMLTIVGYPCAQGLLLKTSDIAIGGGGWIRPVNNTAATIFTIGDDSDNSLVRRISGHLRVGDTRTNYTNYTSTIGLKLIACVEFNLHLDVTACQTAIEMAPTETAVAYNNFFLGMVYNNQYGINLNPSGTGYTNENKFYGGRFSHGSALSGVGIVGVRGPTGGGGGGAPENNIFYGPTFEMAGKSVNFQGPDMCRFVEARFEPMTGGTAGVDYEENLIEFGATSSRNTFEMSMCPEIFSGGRQLDHGSGVLIDDNSFSIGSSDLRGYFYPGALVKFTVSGTTYIVTVRSSSFGSSTTSVTINAPLITGTPSDVTTPRIFNRGVSTSIRIDRADDPIQPLALTAHSFENRVINLANSCVSLQALDADRPALTLVRGTNNSNRAIRVMSSTGESAYLQCTGHLRVSGFGLSALPVVQQTAIPDASTAHALNAVFSDVEVETALNALGTKINAVLAIARSFGLIAT